MALLACLVFTVIGLVLFGIADFWLGLFRPRRSGRWLAIAMLFFTALLGLCLAAASSLTSEAGAPAAVDLLMLAATGAAVGTVWWSFLPPPRRDLAGLFE